MNLYWYTYTQNNSGGFFEGPAEQVFVQATSAEQADEIAETVGIYFDDSGDIDCPCCGSRWDRQDVPWRENGTERPSRYGVEVTLSSEPDEQDIWPRKGLFVYENGSQISGYVRRVKS